MLMTNSQQITPDVLHERRHNIIYKIRLSTLYHRKRERFFDVLDKFVSGFILVTATAAVTSLFQGIAAAEKTLSAATALLSMIPVVFNPAQKARHHNQLIQQYCQLLSQCEQAGEDWDEKQCNQFSAEFVKISAAEPTALGALVADCQNELALSYGEEPPASLNFYHRSFKHFFDMRPPPAKPSQ